MKRPIPVTLVLWAVLMTVAWNLLRIWTSVAWSGALNEFSIRPAPLVGALIGAFWVILGCVVHWGIRREKAWAGKMLLAAAAGYTVWYWGERVAFQNPRPNLWFAVIVNLALLALVFLATRSLSKRET
jgi:hypothetical protein